MKQVKISEANIKKIIAETAKRILKEGYAEGNPYIDKWYYLVDNMDKGELLDIVYKWFNDDQLTALIDDLDKNGYLDGYYEEKGGYSNSDEDYE